MHGAQFLTRRGAPQPVGTLNLRAVALEHATVCWPVPRHFGGADTVVFELRCAAPVSASAAQTCRPGRFEACTADGLDTPEPDFGNLPWISCQVWSTAAAKRMPRRAKEVRMAASLRAIGAVPAHEAGRACRPTY